MSILEDTASSWEKRFMQSHYSYRDSYPDEQDATQLGTTTVLTGLQMLVLLDTQAKLGVPGTVYYPFGYNARNSILQGSIGRWPNLGDYGVPTQSLVPRGQCYARSVKVTVAEDTWIRFISLNPLYTVFLNQLYSVALIASWGISSTITEVEQWVEAEDTVTFSPTYGVALAYRAATAEGAIYIAIEGNVEGAE